MNVMELVRPDERDAGGEVFEGDSERVRWQVDPGTVYPAALDYCEQLAGEPDGYRPNPLRADLAPDGLAAELDRLRVDHLAAQVKALPKDAWKLAREPFREDFTTRQREVRAQALEAARAVFTTLLHGHTGRPMSLHLTRDDAWKL